MFNLILKDILVQKKTLIFALCYSIFIFFAFGGHSFAKTVNVMGSVAISYIFILTAIAYDDKNKSDVILNSLPVKREQIIMAKYLSVFVFVAIALGFMGVIGGIINISGLPFNPSMVSLTDLVTALASVAFLSSVYLPLYYKFGSAYTRMFNIALFLLVFFLPSTLVEILKKYGNREWFNGVINTIQSIPDWAIISALAGATLLFMLVSMLITMRIYKRKDF